MLFNENDKNHDLIRDKTFYEDLEGNFTDESCFISEIRIGFSKNGENKIYFTIFGGFWSRLLDLYRQCTGKFLDSKSIP